MLKLPPPPPPAHPRPDPGGRDRERERGSARWEASQPAAAAGTGVSLESASSGSSRFTRCKQGRAAERRVREPAAGEGRKMATAAHPPEAPRAQAPVARAAALPPALGDRGPLGFSPALGAEPPCGSAGRGPGRPRPRPPPRVRPGHLCNGHIGSVVPVPAPRGAGGQGGARSRLQPPTRAGPGAEAARGELRQDARGNMTASEGSPASPPPAPAPSVPPRHTTPR